MFESSPQWLIFGLDLSIKAILLVAIAGLVLRLLRVRDSNLRHRVWTGVVGGMLLLPWLALTLPAIPLHVPSTSQLAGNERLSAGGEETVSRPAMESDSVDAGEPRSEDAGESGLVDATGAPSIAVMAGDRATPPQDAVAGRAELDSSEANGGTASPSGPISSFHFSTLVRWSPVVLLSVWIVGVACFACRLIVGLYWVGRLRRRASGLDRARVTACLEPSAAKQSTAVAIRQTNE
ncbi:MAG: hypothetical protein MI861_26790, partial [Pirellulales bacterium]|nr:hypothetical protein [Pirellulales bacterium]